MTNSVYGISADKDFNTIARDGSSSQENTSGDNRMLSREDSAELSSRIVEMMKGVGTHSIKASSVWRSGSQWARNRVNVISEQRDIWISISCLINGGAGFASTNQTDDESLRRMVEYVQWQARLNESDPMIRDISLGMTVPSQPQATVWSDKSYQYKFDDSAQFMQRINARADEAGVVAAGYFEVLAGSIYFQADQDPNVGFQSDYGAVTQVFCSVTVRNPSGQGSGWSGLSTWDISELSADDIANMAMDKCMASMNPVRIEPGRYTVILEPQAVSDLITPLIDGNALGRRVPEVYGAGPFFLGTDDALKLYRSKLGLKVMDERITIWHDPSDPETGIISPVPPNIGIQPVTWIKNGVLNSMWYSAAFAGNRLGESESISQRTSYRMSGGTSTLQDMIQSSKRAVLVTRFSPPSVVHNGSMVSSAITRDGLWLIENGKITHAVRNFRTLESPLFVLNNVEELGIPTRVYRPGVRGYSATRYISGQAHNALTSVFVPPLKIRDFSFSSSVDAV